MLRECNFKYGHVLILIVLFWSMLPKNVFSQIHPTLKKNIQYYLPDIAYNPAITTPESFLGFQIGEYHITHDQIDSYIQLLATESDRIEYHRYGKTCEMRNLSVLFVSSPNNLRHKESIRNRHIASTEEAGTLSPDDPLILLQGYSIHGNESSGANASLLVAYYLAAGQSEEVKALLDETIIILDPCYNPDGIQRFSSWVNSKRGTSLVADPQDIEYKEPWPGSRTNHYWSDLNRDWLFLVHPESEHRINLFQQWKPHILTDHHEMGKNSTFFFQPGVPERTNPNTPQQNQDLTEEIGIYHAKALDKIGSKYFSKERFDDFYYGKGSTYPDIQGSIGILFEQASSRGHYQRTDNGHILDFPFTIRNQVATSLSTQRAAMAMHQKLREYHYNFFKNAWEEGRTQKQKAFAFTNQSEYAQDFATLLLKHDINVFQDTRTNQFIVPFRQKQYRLMRTFFDKMTTFPSNTFYDVSTWTVSIAYGLRVKPLFKLPKGITKYHGKIQLKLFPLELTTKTTSLYSISWDQEVSGAFIYDAIQHKLPIQRILNTKEDLKQGDLIIQCDKSTLPTFNQLIQKHAVTVKPLSEQIDNLDTKALTDIRPALLVGPGVNAYDAGDIWHHFDKNLGIPITKLDVHALESRSLERYTVLFMVDGRYGEMSKNTQQKISDWISAGGTLVCIKRALEWAKSFQWINFETIDVPSSKDQVSEATSLPIEQKINGAIFTIRNNPSSSLCRGYKTTDIAIFKRGILAIKTNSTSAVTYSSDALLSGYCSNENIQRVSNSIAMDIQPKGKGKVVILVDNPLFRGYWRVGDLLVNNILFQ